MDLLLSRSDISYGGERRIHGIHGWVRPLVFARLLSFFLLIPSHVHVGILSRIVLRDDDIFVVMDGGELARSRCVDLPNRRS